MSMACRMKRRRGGHAGDLVLVREEPELPVELVAVGGGEGGWQDAAGLSKSSLILTGEERNTLQHWARRRTIGALALRSRMVLASADVTATTWSPSSLASVPRRPANGAPASSDAGWID